ncbi:MAG TPA: NHL repeat-containing protein [Candidatus Cybelea sp.]
MASHRPLFAGSVLLALLAAAGCSAAGTSAVTPAAPQAFARSHGRPIAALGKNYVYVADTYANTVYVFPARPAGANPVGSITSGLSAPQGLAIDAAGNLYVGNPGSATVTIYPPGGTSPSLTLKQDLTVPAAVAVDANGNVWVSNEEGSNLGSLVEFPKGSTTPSTVINGLNPLGVAVDSKGNLYVENENASASFVSVYPPGATKPSKKFGQGNLISPEGITIGPTGDVYVCDFYYAELFIFKAKSYKLRKKVFVPEDGQVPTLSATGRLYMGTGSQAVVSEIGRDGFGKVNNQWYFGPLLSSFGVAADPAVAPGP